VIKSEIPKTEKPQKTEKAGRGRRATVSAKAPETPVVATKDETQQQMFSLDLAIKGAIGKQNVEPSPPLPVASKRVPTVTTGATSPADKRKEQEEKQRKEREERERKEREARERKEREDQEMRNREKKEREDRERREREAEQQKRLEAEAEQKRREQLQKEEQVLFHIVP